MCDAEPPLCPGGAREGGGRESLVIGQRHSHARPSATDPGIPPSSHDHPMFRLVGAGRGGGRTPGARDKHAILDR